MSPPGTQVLLSTDPRRAEVIGDIKEKLKRTQTSKSAPPGDAASKLVRRDRLDMETHLTQMTEGGVEFPVDSVNNNTLI